MPAAQLVEHPDSARVVPSHGDEDYNAMNPKVPAFNESNESAERRHLYYWCSNCTTRIHLETAEYRDDETRNVYSDPDAPKCPICGQETRSWDEIVAYGEAPMNNFTWETFVAWRTKTLKLPL